MIDDKDTKGSPSASLMRIPVEVRTIIFEQLFGRAELCATFDSYSSPTYKKHSGKERRYYPNVSPMYDVGILQSCKQLNEEAAPILKSSLALSCIADDRIFSAAPIARCAKDVQFLTVFGLKWSHFDSLNEFPNLKVLRLNNDRYKRLDWLSSANDEYETEKQLEGFYDAGLKRVWKNDLLMTEWVREIEEQSERTFKIQHKAYMEMDTCHDGDRLIHNLVSHMLNLIIYLLTVHSLSPTTSIICALSSGRSKVTV